MRSTAKEKISEPSAPQIKPKPEPKEEISTRHNRRKPANDRGISTLKEEIAMLRSIMRRVLTLAKEGEPVSELLKILDTVSKASTRLATLLKTQRQLESVQDLAAVLNQAIQEAMNEAGNG